MDEVSAAGAEAVAVYLLQLDPFAYATNDLAEWRQLSHPECIFCASVTSHVEEQIAAGNHSVGGLVTVSGVKSVEIDPARWWSVEVELVQSPSSTVSGTGQVLEDSPETKRYHMDIAVVFDAGHWVVRGLSYTRTG
jgi:hypothetical protein